MFTRQMMTYPSNEFSWEVREMFAPQITIGVSIKIDGISSVVSKNSLQLLGKYPSREFARNLHRSSSTFSVSSISVQRIEKRRT